MLKGLTFLVSRTISQALVEPRRASRFARQAEPYLHRTPSGLLFHLHPGEAVDEMIAVEGIYERRFLNYVRQRIPDGTVMLDIGANIGNHAIYLASRCSEIHCFEPNPAVADRLRRNIAVNKLNHVRVHQFGLGDKDQQLTFHENISGNLGASRFAESGEVPPGHRALTLEIREAATAINALGLKRIDFIKIDVEGMEDRVLASLGSIMDRYRPLVAFEHHEHLLPAGTFDRIRSSFPQGYRIIEAQFAPDGSTKNKILWNLRHDAGPVLVDVRVPEPRSYEALLAVPG